MVSRFGLKRDKMAHPRRRPRGGPHTGGFGFWHPQHRTTKEAGDSESSSSTSRFGGHRRQQEQPKSNLHPRALRHARDFAQSICTELNQMHPTGPGTRPTARGVPTSQENEDTAKRRPEEVSTKRGSSYEDRRISLPPERHTKTKETREKALPRERSTECRTKPW